MNPNLSAAARCGLAMSCARGAFAALAIATLVPMAPAPATAEADEAAARAFAETVGTEFLALAGQTTGDPLKDIELIRPFLEERAAVTVIARFTMGRLWRQMSEDQRTRYTNAILDIASRFLARRLHDFPEPQFEVMRVFPTARNGFLVVTRIWSEELDPIEIEWRLVQDDSGLRVADFLVEGISLLVTYRSEVQALLDKHNRDVEKLIEELREQEQEIL